MVWTEEKLGPIIHSILNPDEEVLSLYQSKTTKSIYGAFFGIVIIIRFSS